MLDQVPGYVTQRSCTFFDLNFWGNPGECFIIGTHHTTVRIISRSLNWGCPFDSNSLIVPLSCRNCIFSPLSSMRSFPLSVIRYVRKCRTLGFPLSRIFSPSNWLRKPISPRKIISLNFSAFEQTEITGNHSACWFAIVDKRKSEVLLVQNVILFAQHMVCSCTHSQRKEWKCLEFS